MPEFKQGALEYPWEITHWKVYFMAGNQTYVFFLGVFFQYYA